MTDTHGADRNKASNMPQRVVTALDVNGIGVSIENQRGIAQVSHMIRSAGFIQGEIPVNPSPGPVLQISDYIVDVAAGGLPEPTSLPFHAPFTEDQGLVRVALMELSEVFKFIP